MHRAKNAVYCQMPPMGYTVNTKGRIIHTRQACIKENTKYDQTIPLLITIIANFKPDCAYS